MRSFRPTTARCLAALLAALAVVPVLAQGRAGDAERIAALRANAVALEHGNGMARDGARAAALYCEAARLGDAASQFDLGWMLANGRGVPRDDGTAAYFFQLAAAQGVDQARSMLEQTGEAPLGVPDCMADPVAVPPPPAFEPPAQAPRAIADLVQRVAAELGVRPALVFAIIEAESRFDVRAVSPKNARGLMQLVPETAERFRVRNPFDPDQNVRGGVAYLRWLLAYFEGDVRLVAAAYNAGERAVERHGGVPPYPETRAYVRRIVAAVGPLTQPFDPSVVEASAMLPRLRDGARPR